MQTIKEKHIKVLDCTLRDGGHVNKFLFKEKNIKLITNGLIDSKVDIIELGFLMDCVPNSHKTQFNKISDAECFLGNSKSKTEFCLMIRPDWYTAERLEVQSGNIKSLRFAFHYKDLSLTLRQVKIAQQKGYTVYLNPVNIFSYTKRQLTELLDLLNKAGPKGVSIVDTFGSMMPHDLPILTNSFNEHLDPNIAIGLHLHENLSLSFALSIIFLDAMKGKRQCIIDSSILGMGRAPGNLCSELVLNYLNINHNAQYNLDAIYKLIDNPINGYMIKNPWGYLPAYALTAFNKTHRSYAEHLIETRGISLERIARLIVQIQSEHDKINFNTRVLDLINSYP